jgi:hypothetical protein
VSIAEDLSKLLAECGRDPQLRAVILATQVKERQQATLEQLAEAINCILELLREKERQGRLLSEAEQRTLRLIREMIVAHHLRIDMGDTLPGGPLAAGNDERAASLLRQRETCRANINRLEEMRLSFGASVPLEILNQLDDARETLERIERELAEVTDGCS